jgi:hypothetical protein
MRNVTPSRSYARSQSQPQSRRRTLLVVGLVVLVILFARSHFGGQNKYEAIARGVTDALQKNDLAAVQKYENAETAAEMSRVRVARAADQLAPLGAIQRVHETTPKAAPPRVHEFDLAFAKGSLHERMQLDPQDKVVHFHYDAPQLKQ